MQLLLLGLSSLLLVAHASRNRNDVLRILRSKQNAIVTLADSEQRQKTTGSLVLDVRRAHGHSKGTLVVVADGEAVRRYRDFFRTASPSTSVGFARGSLTDDVLFANDVTMVTAEDFVQELREGTMRLDRLHLLVVDDVSRILPARDALRKKLRTCRPSKLVGYRVADDVQDLERVFEGTSATQEDTQQAESTTLVPDFGLNSLEKRILNTSFPQDLVDQSLGGYRFKNPDLLIRALLHPNFRANQRRRVSYKPLDYVGNFVLDFITSRHILRANATSKDRMHGLKRRILSSRSCAYYAARNHFDRFVLIDDGREKRQMMDYATAARAAGEPGGQRCFLSEVFKSVAGAVYVDSGYDSDTVEAIYLGLMGQHISS